MIFSPKMLWDPAILTIWAIWAPQACFTRVFKANLPVLGGRGGLNHPANRKSKLKSWSETRLADDKPFYGHFRGVKLLWEIVFFLEIIDFTGQFFKFFIQIS